MSRFRPVIRVASTLLVACLFLAVAGAACASPRMVSIARDNVNMRSGPGLGYEVLWYLSRGYPLEVMAAKGEWLKVRDYEGDIGWVFRKLTSRESHVIVKKENVNLRSRPDVKSSVVVRVNRGVLLRSLGSQGRWVKVRYAQGGSGWIARRLVWGW